MKKNIALKKNFEKILQSGDFSQLKRYESCAQIENWSAEDRLLLAQLFNRCGEKQLEQGNDDVINSFEKAAKLAPEDPQVFYQQAMILSFYEENPRCLELAGKALSAATSLDHSFLHAWVLWGRSLVNLGIIHVDSNCFLEAHHKYKQAEQIAKSDPAGNMLAEIYFQWGFCCFCEGKLSGEACDFFNAVAYYKKTASLDYRPESFWNAYGDALSELACLISNDNLFTEAADKYRKAIQRSPDYFEAWLNLACATQKLYEAYTQPTDYDNACDAFQRAVEINSDDPIVWLKWGQLLLLSGKIHQDSEKILDSLHKFSKANTCNPDQPEILGQWSDALLTAGIFHEKVEFLKQSQDTIIKALKSHPEKADYWYIYGSTLNELGLYFSEESFFHQSIEKFSYGLKMQETHLPCLQGIAQAHYSVGDLRYDAAWIEKALFYSAKVSEQEGHCSPQFWNDWGIALMKLAEMTNDKAHLHDALEKFEKAIEVFNDANPPFPLDPQWLYNYGCALDFLGDLTEEASCYEKAIHILTKALQLSPSYTHARYNLALAYSHLGELVGEIDCFVKSLELFHTLLSQDREDEMAWNDCGLVFINYAQIMEDPAHPEISQKLYEQAEHKFLEAAALGSTQSYYNLSCLYSLIGKNQEALHYLEKAERVQHLPPIEEILQDEWLDGLRQTNDFKEFLFYLTKDQSESIDEMN
jgi:tetratricopeptide (TPR) repeat protein